MPVGRFIPAQAGNTGCGMSWPRRSTVHPRAGGEHSVSSAAALPPVGSSPRRRGTLLVGVYGDTRRRFIPAQAGNTSSSVHSSPSPTVHPRAGGEHAISVAVAIRSSGSSPRRRGTLGHERPQHVVLRFIPAQAGNTLLEGLLVLCGPVHPRAGGEHVPVLRLYLASSGSSPRRRGTLAKLNRRRNLNRFIPAQAGNTSRPRSAWARSSVHPRAGGEHRLVAMASIADSGSSPRRRGTRGHRESGVPVRRFIPAQAGNTASSKWQAFLTPVHPRAGGEHIEGKGLSGPITGSSPRRRGTRRVGRAL